MNKRNLVGWLFTYNEHTDTWGAATRDNKDLLTCDWTNPLVLKSSEFKTLEEIIMRTNGKTDELPGIDNSLETGKLPEPFKSNWLAALRSGEYKQGRTYLCGFASEMCCLGVAEIVAGNTKDMIKDQTYPWNLDSPYSPALLANEGDVPRNLASMNDIGGNTFIEIADYIEKNL